MTHCLGFLFHQLSKHYKIRDFILVSPKYCFIVNEISAQIWVENALSSLKYFLPWRFWQQVSPKVLFYQTTRRHIPSILASLEHTLTELLNTTIWLPCGRDLSLGMPHWHCVLIMRKICECLFKHVHCTYLKEYEGMGTACSTYVGEERCIKGFGGEAWRKKTTWKTQA